jgi:hypothetical protein
MLSIPIDSLPLEPEEPSSPPPFYLRRISFDLDTAPSSSDSLSALAFRRPAHFRR